MATKEQNLVKREWAGAVRIVRGREGTGTPSPLPSDPPTSDFGATGGRGDLSLWFVGRLTNPIGDLCQTQWDRHLACRVAAFFQTNWTGWKPVPLDSIAEGAT